MTCSIQLTLRALKDYLNGHGPDNPILQVINLKKILPSSTSDSNSKHRYRIQLSDSIHYQPCMLMTRLNYLADNGDLDQNSVVCINNMNCTHINGMKILVISHLTVLHKGADIVHIIGKPEKLDFERVAQASSTLLQPIATTSNATQSVPDKFSFINQNNEPAPEMSRETTATSSSSQHNNNLQTIASLNPYQTRWVICCRVTFKGPLRDWSNSRGEGKVFSFEVRDTSGIIKCTAFNDKAITIDKLIALDKVIYISRGEIRPSNKKFAGNSTHDYELCIQDGTIVEDCITRDAINVPSIKHEFKNILQIKNMPKESIVDFIGVCSEIEDVKEIVARNSGRQVKKRGIKLIDETKMEIVCTIWGTDAEAFQSNLESVILIQNARVSDFNGCNLNVNDIASIIVNSDMKECLHLKKWYETEGKYSAIETIQRSPHSYTMLQEITPISDAKINFPSQNQSRVDYFTFRATIIYIKKDINVLYKACPNQDCNKKLLEDEAMGTYRCEKCNREFNNFKFRYRLNIEIQDHSGSIWVTCFQEAAEVVLGCDSDYSHELQTTKGKEALDDLLDSKLFQTFYFKVNIRPDTYQDETRLKVTAMQIKSIDGTSFQNDCNNLLGLINNLKS